MTSKALEASGLPAASAPSAPSPRMARRDQILTVLLPVVSIAAALVLWELISRTEVIPQRDLAAMPGRT